MGGYQVPEASLDKAQSAVLLIAGMTIGLLYITPASAHVPTGFGYSYDYLFAHLKPFLATPGTINSGGNPVDWTRLKNVPAGFADGVDATSGTSGAATDVVCTDCVTSRDLGAVTYRTTFSDGFLTDPVLIAANDNHSAEYRYAPSDALVRCNNDELASVAAPIGRTRARPATVESCSSLMSLSYPTESRSGGGCEGATTRTKHQPAGMGALLGRVAR